MTDTKDTKRDREIRLGGHVVGFLVYPLIVAFVVMLAVGAIYPVGLSYGAAVLGAYALRTVAGLWGAGSNLRWS